MRDCFRPIRKTASSIAVLAILAFANFPARAEPDPARFEYGEIDALFEDPQEKSGHISFGPLDPAFDAYFDWKESLAENHGFFYLIEDRLINSWGDGSHIHDNEVNVIGRWEFLSGEGAGTHSINFWGQFAQSLGGTTGSEFQADLRILSPLCGCNGGPATTNEILQMLAYEFMAPNEKFRFQVGKLATRTLINLNRYANGDSEMFFSPMLGNNTVAAYTALLGLGAFAQWREEAWYLSGLVRAPDAELGISFDALHDGDLAYVVEFALTPAVPQIGYGEYRFTYSYDQSTSMRPSVTTIGLSFDQDIGDRIGAFFKYHYSDDTFRSFNAQFAAGFQIKKPFGFIHDRIGVGAWIGDPSASGLSNEYGTEIFYKAQIKPFLEITPNLQFVFNPAFSSSDVETVAGIRLRGVL